MKRMLSTRPMKRMTFAQRVAFPGCPVVWCVVFTQEVAPFLTDTTTAVFCISYIVVVTWYGTFRELKPFDRRDTHKKNMVEFFMQIALRLSNTISDAACATCFLFFLRNATFLPTVWFPPMLFGALFFHTATEMEVDRRFRALYANRSFLGGRRPDTRQMEALSALEETKLLPLPVHPEVSIK